MTLHYSAEDCERNAAQEKRTMSHTPEPWKQGTNYPGRVLSVPTNRSVAECGLDTDQPSEEELANAARIVACVNGCAGLNPASSREVVEALHSLLACRWVAETSSVEVDAAQQALAHAEAPHCLTPGGSLTPCSRIEKRLGWRGDARQPKKLRLGKQAL